jgi:putative minor tail subunit
MDIAEFFNQTSLHQRRQSVESDNEYTVRIEVRDGTARYLGDVGDWSDLSITWTSEADSSDASSFTIGGTSAWSKHFMRSNLQVCLVHFLVYRAGSLIKTWTGRVSRSTRTGNGPQSTIKVELDHDKVWLQHILAWPSPFAVLNAQFPKRDIALGPAIHVMKDYVIKAAVRLQANQHRLIANYKLADYQNDPGKWRDLQSFMHPVIVPPTPKGADTTPNVALVAEMTPISELVAETCKDNNILPDVYCYVPGRDPKISGINMAKPGIVIDFVDKDRTRLNPTYRSFFAEITREIRTFIRGIFGRYDIPPSLQPTVDTKFLRDFFGTDTGRYNVSWPILRSSDEHWHQQEVNAFAPTTYCSITGGKSNEFLNQGIKLIARTLIQQVLRLIGIGFSALTGWITGKLEDIFFAYQRAEDSDQKRFLGDFALPEDYGGKGYTAYSRDAAQALRMQRYSALGYKTAQFTGNVNSFLPFRVFEDFDLLDPVGWEDDDSDRIIPERLKQVTLTANRENGVVFEVRLGESDRPEEPWAIQSRRNAQFLRAITAAFNAE